MQLEQPKGVLALFLTTIVTALPTGSPTMSRQISACETQWMNSYMSCVDACPDGGLTNSTCVSAW